MWACFEVESFAYGHPSVRDARGVHARTAAALLALPAHSFLTDYPTPESAALLGEGRMGQFCRRHAYRGGKSPAALLGRLRAAPASADRACQMLCVSGVA